MLNQKDDAQSRITASRVGFWVAITTTLLAAVSFGIAVATPPRSGPFCNFDTCVAFPYTEIADFFPRDYIWMIPATLLLFTFIVLMVCVHYYASDNRKPFSLAGLSFAAISTAVLSIDYFIQFTVIQPSILRGETGGISLFSQYNPHGIFIALEELGYLTMSLAFFFVALVFNGHSWVERALRWLLIIAFAVVAISLAALALLYGNDLEYRFEVEIIAVNWIALIASGVLLSILFRRTQNTKREDIKK